MSVSAKAHIGHGESTGAVTSFVASRFRRTITATFTGAGGALTLPSAATMPGAGPDIFHIFNDGVFDFDVEDADGGLIGTEETGLLGTIDLSNRVSAAGTWHMSKSGTSGAKPQTSVLIRTIGDPLTNVFTISGTDPV